MSKVPSQNNFFDSASMGNNTKTLNFIFEGKHYWHYLLDEMFVYCSKNSNKQKIQRYLQTLTFQSNIPAATKSTITVRLPNINEDVEYSLSNEAIRAVLYGGESSAKEHHIYFLKKLQEDYYIYYKNTTPVENQTEADKKLLFNKICMFLKYSGDQSHILQMHLRPNDENVLLTIDRNLISRATLDNRVGRYMCPYSEAFKRSLKKRTNEAFEKGIFGAPSFVSNNKIFWGQDRMEFVLKEASK